jgi:hypothetical protein
MRTRSLSLVFVTLALVAAGSSALAGSDPADRVQVTDASDARAIEIAQSVMAKMGGWESWDATRYLSWHFFGGRVHHWDRYTGDVRISGKAGEHTWLWLMNVSSREGRVWKNGTELSDPAELAEALETGRKIWVNDSYWVVMPYKLLDPGVTLKYSGERAMEDGRVADVLDLTFGEGIGYTPQNRYEVFVARDTGLVEQWAFFSNAEETEPRFTMPWKGWQKFGRIMLATGRGRDADWRIAVHDALPESVFNDPEATID